MGLVGGAFGKIPEKGFFFGGAVNVLFLGGTGDYGDVGVDLTDVFFREKNTDNFGMNWDGTMLYGIKPMVGFKVNAKFSIYADYSYLLTKNSDDRFEFDNGYADDSYIRDIEFEWSQHSIEMIYSNGSASEKRKDDISAMGIIIGGGIEFPTGGKNITWFGSAQYSTAKTDDDMKKLTDDNDDFEIKVGGLSAMVGIKYYMPSN